MDDLTDVERRLLTKGLEEEVYTGTLDADTIAARLRTRLAPRLGDRLAPPPPAPRQLIPLSVNRTPYFCSGCPHNTGAKAPDRALIGGGIGCHAMVMLMEMMSQLILPCQKFHQTSILSY